MNYFGSFNLFPSLPIILFLRVVNPHYLSFILYPYADYNYFMNGLLKIGNIGGQESGTANERTDRDAKIMHSVFVF